MPNLIRAAVLLVAFISSNGAALAEEKDRLDFSGRVMLDVDRFGSFWNKDGDNSTTEAEVSSARFEIEYDFPKGWLAKLQIDAELDSDDSDANLGSAYVRYTKWDLAEITLGRMKEPVGLERITTTDRLMTIERSMVSTAFTPGKSWGIHLSNGNKRRRWGLAIVQEDDQGDNYHESPPKAVSGRFVWYPINSDDQTLQFGASGSIRDWNENEFRIRNRAEVATANRVVRGARFIADNQKILSLEGVWRRKSLLLQAEYIATRVAELNGPDWDYNGYYVLGSYFLTGESHRFRRGRVRSVRPLAGSGAWELVARYSYLDVRQRGLGSIASATTLGINYYFGSNIKVMLDYLHPDISGSVRHEDPDGNALSLRLQYLF